MTPFHPTFLATNLIGGEAKGVDHPRDRLLAHKAGVVLLQPVVPILDLNAWKRGLLFFFLGGGDKWPKWWMNETNLTLMFQAHTHTDTNADKRRHTH